MIPKLFQEIIRYDQMKNEYYKRDVLYISDHKKFKEVGQQLRTGAENFLKRQRTGTPA